MAETFNYTREWTDEKAFPLLGFSRDWNNPEDYPTVETDERKVREDMQSLHDEVKNYLNESLIPAVIAEEALVEDWEHAESLRAEAEAARVEAEAERASAEGVRAEAEQLRAEAETARVAAETTRANAESARVISEQGRSDAENVRVEAEAARVTAEAERAHEATGYVARAGVYANNAKVYAEGGSLEELVELPNGDVGIGFTTEYTRGAEQYADDSKIYAQGGYLSMGGAAPLYFVGSRDYAAEAKAYAESGSYKSADSLGDLQTVTVEKGAKQYAEEARTAANEASASATSAQTAATEAYDNRVATNTYKEQARSASQSASTSASNASKAETSARSYASAAQHSMQTIEISLTEARREANKAMVARDEAVEAQTAAEKARDEAQAAVGGDFVTHPELEEALANAGISYESVVAKMPSNSAWKDVCYGNGVFVAIAEDGTLVWSESGVVWNTASVDGDAVTSLAAVTYTDGRFFAAGALNRGLTSSVDGKTWTNFGAPVSASSTAVSSVCYGGGTVVVGCGSGFFKGYYSTDNGQTWTQCTAPALLGKVVYGGGRFVAVSSGNPSSFMYSTDGATWTSATSVSDTFSDICYSGEKFVAIGGVASTAVMVSDDGISWTQHSAPLMAWTDIAYGEGTFVATSGYEDPTYCGAAYSEDGETWTMASMPNTAVWSTVACDGDKFVALANGSDVVAVSYDGITWHTDYAEGVLVQSGENITTQVAEALAKQLGSGLPAHTTADTGKFLRIVNGAPAWATVQNAEEVIF